MAGRTLRQIVAAAPKAAEAAALEISELAVNVAREHAPVRKAFKEKSTRRPRFRLANPAEREYLMRGNPSILHGYAGTLGGHAGRKTGSRPYGSGTFTGGRGRGEILIRQRGGTNRYPGRAGARLGEGSGLLLGVETNSQYRDIKSGVFNLSKKAPATKVENVTRQRPDRFGRTQIEVVPGYRLKGRARQQSLTSRARYELMRGIGTHKVRTATGGKTEVRYGGALRKSIRSDVKVSGDLDKVIDIKITAGNDEVTYAKYVEFGTYKDRAQPFMYPALKIVKRQQLAILSKHLRAAGFRVKG